MPNGRPRQSNTRAANRQRNVQRDSEVRAEPVQEAVVVQAEAVPQGGGYYSDEKLAELIQELVVDMNAELIKKVLELEKWKKQSVIREKKLIKGAVFEGYNLCHLARESGVVKPLQEGEFYEATNSSGSPDEFFKNIQTKYGD